MCYCNKHSYFYPSKASYFSSITHFEECVCSCYFHWWKYTVEISELKKVVHRLRSMCSGVVTLCSFAVGWQRFGGIFTPPLSPLLICYPPSCIPDLICRFFDAPCTAPWKWRQQVSPKRNTAWKKCEWLSHTSRTFFELLSVHWSKQKFYLEEAMSFRRSNASIWNRNSTSISTWLVAREELGAFSRREKSSVLYLEPMSSMLFNRSRQGKWYFVFSSPPRPDRLWVTPSLISNGYWGALSRW